MDFVPILRGAISSAAHVGVSASLNEHRTIFESNEHRRDTGYLTEFT